MNESPRILIVDDDANMRRSLQLILEQAGYRLEEARTIGEALDRAREQPFDLAMVDVRLPDGQGVDLLAPLKAMRPDLDVIVTSGYSSMQTTVQALNDGAAAYMTKPIQMDDLLARIRHLLEKQELVREKRRAEEEVRRLKELNETIVQNLAEGIVASDVPGRITFVNPAVSRMLGYGADELIGQSIRQLVPADQMPLVDAVEERRRQGQADQYELELLRRNGTCLPVLISGSPVFDGDSGDFEGTVAVITDISQRVQAEREARHRTAQLEALHQVALDLAAEGDVETLLRSIVSRAIELVRAKAGGIYLYQPERDLLVRRVSLGKRPLPLGTVRRRGEGLSGKAWQAGRPMSVADYAGWEGQATSLRPPSIGAAVAVPVHWGAEFLGVLTVSRTPEGSVPFSPAEVDLLSMFGTQAAIAIHNTRTLDAERTARRETETLHAATQALSSSLDLQQVFATILTELRCVVPYDSASVQRLRGDRLEIIGGYGFPNLEELLGATFDLNADDSPNPLVVRSRAPLILADATASYAGFRIEPHAQAGTRSWLGVPLLFGDRLIGMLAIDKKEPGFYTEEHARLAGAFAAQAAIAIENARLYEESRQRNRELALLNRVIAASAASSDLVAILETVCRELALYFDVPQAAAGLFDEGGNTLRMVAEYVAPGRPSPVGAALPTENDSILRYLRESKEPLVADDVRTDPRYARGREFLASRGVVSLLLLPLVVGGEVMGVLGVESIEPRPFSADEVELTRRVTSQVSGALARARLEAERQRLSTAVEQSPASVVITDMEGGIVYVNPAFVRTTGYSRAEAVGRPAYMLVRDGPDPNMYGHMLEAFDKGQVWHGRLVTQRKDGSSLTEDATAAPVRDRAGELLRVVLTMRDVSREIELEEQFRQAQKLDAIGRLAGGVAHDFNNLLTIIHISTRLMERSLHPGDPLAENVARIREAGDRATTLTKQLLSFSRRDVSEPRVLNLNRVVDDLSRMLQRIIGEHIEFETRLAPDPWPVEVDPAQLEQVIINLAVNARDAMPEGGKLLVETESVVLDDDYAARHLDVEPGRYLLLSVSDTGCGMDDEVKEHLFEPFFTTKEKGKGTGLGLATVFGIVKQHGGHVWAYSEVGHGTAFKIYLPCVDGDRPAAPAKGEGSEDGSVPAARGTETILLVEDEKGVREMVSSILESQGYRVLVASDGQEGLRLSEQYEGPIHLVLTDTVMPHMNGLQLIEEVRRQRPEARMLIMSGYAGSMLASQGLLVSDVPFLSKPFDAETLMAQVRELLDGA